LINSGENKQSLIRFLGDYIVKHINQNSSLQEGQSLYLAGLFSNPETVKMLNQNGTLDCSCLASTQEEADTRIILHALYSDQLYQENNVQGCVVVKSPEVLVSYGFKQDLLRAQRIVDVISLYTIYASH
jgi:hypothetical protein